jgi:Mlc titration factor MtfA (ptsG expression regulator)
MWSPVRNWRRRRALARADTSEVAWRTAWSRLPLLEGLSVAEGRRLRELAALFLAEKTLEPAQDLKVEPWMTQELALQAALPVLGLDLDWYRGWYSVVLYPDTFVSEFETEDEAGVVHRVREERSGEAWDRGPLVLSWADVEAGTRPDGFNVVIHELAHKLDVLNGAVNGMPPLHRTMSPRAWAEAFQAAYDDLAEQVDAGRDTLIDPYAAESPAEFFAVVSEAFFEVPGDLQYACPGVYAQLRQFYRQDPLARLAASAA